MGEYKTAPPYSEDAIDLLDIPVICLTHETEQDLLLPTFGELS